MISNPANGKEVGLVIDLLTWLIKTVAEAVIRYGVSKVLDYLLKRRWFDAQIASENDATPKRFSGTNFGGFFAPKIDDWFNFMVYVHIISAENSFASKVVWNNYFSVIKCACHCRDSCSSKWKGGNRRGVYNVALKDRSWIRNLLRSRQSARLLVQTALIRSTTKRS